MRRTFRCCPAAMLLQDRKEALPHYMQVVSVEYRQAQVEMPTETLHVQQQRTIMQTLA